MPGVVPVAPFTFVVAMYRQVTGRKPPDVIRKVSETEKRIIETIEGAVPTPPGGFPRIEYKEYTEAEAREAGFSLPRLTRTKR